MRSVVAVVVFLAVCSGTARALPGQTRAQFFAWAKANPALGTLLATRSELSGDYVYTKDFRVGTMRAAFRGEPSADRGMYERIFIYDETQPGFDLRKHPSVVQQMVKHVYGTVISDDLRHARIAGDYGIYQSTMRTTIFRGQRYAYAVAGNQVEVFPLGQLSERLKFAKQCERTECGD